MSIDSGQHIHRNTSAFRVLFRRECRDAYEISNCSDLEKSRSRNLKDCVQHGAWGGASTSRNYLFQEKPELIVFRICNTNVLPERCRQAPRIQAGRGGNRNGIKRTIMKNIRRCATADKLPPLRLCPARCRLPRRSG